MIDDQNQTAFLKLLRHGIQHGGFEIDDAIAILLPLMREVAGAHDAGLVAPLRGTDELHLRPEGMLGVNPESFRNPQRNYSRIQELTTYDPAAPVPAAGLQLPVRRTPSAMPPRNEVADSPESLSTPAFLPGYVSWEHAIGHHDPVTDVFSLGLLLASLACNLDFTRLEDLKRFAKHRENLFELNKRLHPVVSRVIVQMTELDRHERAPDLGQIIGTLETYRDQPVDFDLSGYEASTPADRRRLIRDTLRDRLFEISRRNRLLYFRDTLQTLNLTIASVPIVSNPTSIRPEQLFVWQSEVAADLSQGHPLSLGKWLRLEDSPYIPSVLDKIITEARRDRAEFGFAQLRLVLCFLRWHNLKEAPEERIHSPLLLLPVELSKRRGVRDAYVLAPVSSEAEVNPALRHHLKTLYGIALPESIDLQQTSLEAFHARLQEQIRASEPGVTLDKLDSPRIEALHTIARQRVEQWRKRLRSQETANPRMEAESAGGILSSASAAETATSYPPTEDVLAAEEPPRRRTAPRPDDPHSGNPYRWAFDLCNLTLGNLHYRKMTLVRDYANLAEEGVSSAGFDAVFSVEPKNADEPCDDSFPLRDQYPIIPCDSAQAAAVARSRRGTSFIIQGPPGTGKSQTITNLIADYIARGQRVLFVCEKRAAIDVVFHRLRQQGLDELCCLIHDSQNDKKTFIQNLKETYERWLAEPVDEEAERSREQTLHAIEHDVEALDRFSRGMTHTAQVAGLPTRRLIHRLVELTDRRTSLQPETEELITPYSLWLTHGAVVERLDQAVRALGQENVFARHPFRWLARDAILSPRPLEYVQQRLDTIEPLLDALESSLELSGLPEGVWDTLPDIEAILNYSRRILPLAERALLSLLEPSSPLSAQLHQSIADIDAAEKAWTAAKKATQHWRSRLEPSDTVNALEVARRYEGSARRFLHPSFWRLRRAVHQRYDFDAHAVPPTLRRVLEDLHVEQLAEKAFLDQKAKFMATFGEPTPAGIVSLVGEARGTEAPLKAPVSAFRRALVENADGATVVRSLAELQPSFARLQTLLSELLWLHELLDVEGLRQVITHLRRDARSLPDLIPLLSELIEAPESLRYALANVDVRLDQFEAASADKTLVSLYRADTALTRFDGRMLDAYRERLEKHYRTLLKKNASVIRNRVRRSFREHVQLSGVPTAQLTEEQIEFKKAYSSGRHDLEHEFGKTVRYRSIRDLVAGPSGKVVRDLKPVWLMSPLSVSDTLPLDPDAFDVVIFDEASQIPVEEAVPAVYRAKQVIVVGDQMQLPPTTFFSSSRDISEPLETESGGERVEVDLDADSFLAQSERNLPSTLLAWHYRSRYESLISFSNAAFYAGNLLTIPDRHLASSHENPLLITSHEQAPANVEALLARSISFHFLENGIYEQRRNGPEARYIAETVRELLRRNAKQSIGIVAFSEAQQTEIERAMDALAEEDKEFGARLEAEVSREENDQFCGLFVKNLENVQGDERDIILLSICYGRDRYGRMLMNFGPINQRGGEKRLNVIFSRARHHMAVVSSIRHDDITNEYNDGANALRHFLRYAESLSRGDVLDARSVLENLNPLNRRTLAPPTGRDAVVEQIALALRRRGHSVDINVGQSRFRCDLAICSTDGNTYALGIFVDTDAHYENTNLIDRYLTRPSILEAFGWEVLIVLSKDWLHEPMAVLERIERSLRGETSEAAKLPQIPAAVRSAPAQSPAQSAEPTAPAADSEPRRGSKRPAAAGAIHRYLEYRDADTQKFWEITVSGESFTVRFGRVGTAGQTQQKQFPSAEKATNAALQLVQAKLNKGFLELRR
ncbi:DNA helicase [Opitutaceae bacterium EW11]|nr:DNA helicase [Opitutaceae bacterium EW11]